MRRLPVRISESAIDDLWQIGRFLHQNGAGRSVIDRFVERIEQKCHSIGDAPEGYPLREDIGPGLRAVPFEHSALITYRLAQDAVEIVNVFYGGRDYGAAPGPKK